MPEAGSTKSRTALEAQLFGGRERFLEFVASRVDDRALAEDILQEALLRALSAADGLRDEDRLVSWFYRILRNAIIDAYRRRAVERRHVVPIVDDSAFPDVPREYEAALCECFRALLPSLRPDHAELIEAIDLNGEAPSAVAERLGITGNNLKVRRHRARRALRTRLEQTCRVCAEHGCLDCTCEAARAAEPT